MGEPELPNNWYQSTWFKGVFDFAQYESCQNCVLTIPLCRGGRDETTGENGVKIGLRTWPHSPSLSGKASAHARRHAPRFFFAQMGWPDPHVWPGYEWRQHDIIVMSACTVGMSGMTSAWCKCDVSMHSRHAMSAVTSLTSQQTRQHSGTHRPRHQPRAEPRQAELSRAEPSRGIRFCAAESTCNRIWVLIKS
jgi:hypothetical protein